MLNDNSVKFDVKHAIKFLLEKHGLWERTLNNQLVTMSATIDGGDLAWGLTQVSAGVKIVDHKAKDPITGRLLFGASGHKKVQSRDNCYPLYIFIAKDNKELYQTHLSQFFREVNELEEEYKDGLRFCQGADMCSLQKTLGLAMKCKNYGCYCCSVHREDLAKPRATPCQDCVRLEHTHLPCYHHDVTDKNIIERLREERLEHLRTWPHLNNMEAYRGRSRIRCGNTAIVGVECDPLHVEFQPRNWRERTQFHTLLETEMKLRNIPFNRAQTTQELRIIVSEILLIEKSFELVSDIVSAVNFNDAMIRLEQALPCLLHLENRSSETIIEHLLRRGITLLDGNQQLTKQFMLDVENIMNDEIFGHNGCRSSWRFPVNDDGSMGQIKFANWRARRVIERIDSIIELCIPGDERIIERNKWRDVISSYRLTIQVCSLHFLNIYITLSLHFLLMLHFFFHL